MGKGFVIAHGSRAEKPNQQELRLIALTVKSREK